MELKDFIANFADQFDDTDASEITATTVFHDLEEYSSLGIRYTREVNDAPKREKNYLFSEYGENPYDQRSHRYPEHLLRRRENGTTE